MHTATSAEQHGPRIYETHDYYVLELDDATSPDLIAARLHLRHEGELRPLDGHHVFSSIRRTEDAVKSALIESRRLKRDLGDSDILDGVRFAEKQVPRKPWEKRTLPKSLGTEPLAVTQGPDPALLQEAHEITRRLQIFDPIFNEQWHLFNTVQKGQDVNVTGLWLEGITGHNVTVSIVDDGLDMYSDDLKHNYYAEGSWDFNDRRDEPRPTLQNDKHGTRCAGEVAATKNDVCGVGVAYDSRVSGLRILSNFISDIDEAVAMTYDYEHNNIYSCSWGPIDDGQTMEGPSILVKKAILKGVQGGRNGKGSIYVFASGNGAAREDNCNYDGFTNSIYSITIGAIDRQGQHPYYSEKCSALMVVTYSSGATDSIHTTDVGQNACTDRHDGTSAAAPLGAGIYALVLSVRPDLHWRDLQWLQVLTAVPVNDHDGEWQRTPLGVQFSHTYGYGKIDAYAIVEAAKTWELVRPQAWFYSPWVHVNQAIPQGKDGLAITYVITADDCKEANLARIEHVTITMNVDHTSRGELSADLISPQGIVSHIATTRKYDLFTGGWDKWTFMSVAHWGESGIGKWTVIVKDSLHNEHRGNLIDFRIQLWGESIDADKAVEPLIPSEDDDKAQTTTIAAVTSTVDGEAGASASGITPPTVLMTLMPTQGAHTPPSNGGSWLPSPGVSKSAQVWIYGALTFTIFFCVGVSGWFVWLRRRKTNSNRDDYDFELLNEEDEGNRPSETGTGRAVNNGCSTRGGELHGAFAGGGEHENDELLAAVYSEGQDASESMSRDEWNDHMRSSGEEQKANEDEDNDNNGYREKASL